MDFDIMTKKKTTININKELLRLIKIKALDLNITQTELITLYLKYGLTNHMQIKKPLTEKNYIRYKKKHQKK